MISNLRAYDIVHKALRVCGVVGLGEPPDALVYDEALMLLNGLRAEWSLSSKNYKLFDSTYAVTTNKQFITLGTQDIAGVPTPGDIPDRPYKITNIYLINGNLNSNLNLALPISPYAEYRAQTAQNIYSIPERAYIDSQMPYTNIFFYPGLTAGWQVRVIGSAYMTEYENIADPYIDPPEFFDPLYLALALRVAPLHGAVVPEGVVQQAASAIKHIQAKLVLERFGKMAGPNSANGFNFWAGR